MQSFGEKGEYLMADTNHFPGGAWPVMLTPFTDQGAVDYDGLGKLIDWYMINGASGLFAVCQSSEVFFLSLEERVNIARYCVERSGKRIPVIASGHISDSFDDQVRELNKIADTGVEAVILITNRIARQDESDEVWLKNLQKLVANLPEDVKLGFYECPYPYKRVLSKEVTRQCAETGRFYFLKDTSCDLDHIAAKLEVSKGTNLHLYNANTATLLDSLKLGASGYSGVMCNTQCRLYSWFLEHWKEGKAQELSDLLTISSWMEHEYYPVSAKYYLQKFEALPISTFSRTKDASLLSRVVQSEMAMLKRVTETTENKFINA